MFLCTVTPAESLHMDVSVLLNMDCLAWLFQHRSRPTTASKFLSLPAEVRCRIYRWLFYPDPMITIDKNLAEPNGPPIVRSLFGHKPLLLTCKRIKQEVDEFRSSIICIRINDQWTGKLPKDELPHVVREYIPLIRYMVIATSGQIDIDLEEFRSLDVLKIDTHRLAPLGKNVLALPWTDSEQVADRRLLGSRDEELKAQARKLCLDQITAVAKVFRNPARRHRLLHTVTIGEVTPWYPKRFRTMVSNTYTIGCNLPTDTRDSF